MSDDLGIDKVGPKVLSTGPYDDGTPFPDDRRECEGCGHKVLRENGMDLEGYGWWCYGCLDERLKVE